MILSFDMNTDGPKNGAPRRAFEAAFQAAGWRNEILVSGTWETLPETTLVVDRSDNQARDDQARDDVREAEMAARKVEPLFKVTRFVLSGYRRIDSRIDKTRPGTSMRDLLRTVGHG